MRLAVIGSRTFNDYRILETTLDHLIKPFKITTIISGGAKGADSLAEKYATENGLDLQVFRPEWKKYGRSAGFIRNATIWDNSDMGVAFWDGQSRGTEHSFSLSKKQKKQLFVFDYSKMDFYLI